MKTVCRSFMCVLVVTALATSISLAGEKKEHGKGNRTPPAPKDVFARIDADGSGGVTLEEFKVHHEKRMEHRRKRAGEGANTAPPKTPPSAEEIFGKMDADGDGLVSEAEFVAAPRPGRGPHGHRGDRKKAPEAQAE